MLLTALDRMRQAGYGYAIIGGVGPTAFYAKTVGAIVIDGSSPGIYTEPLTRSLAVHVKKHCDGGSV